ncbi:MAG: phosphorylase, partial [Saprospiraceae bacterium]
TETALGMDGLLNFYEKQPTNLATIELENAFLSFCKKNNIGLPVSPYFAAADAGLLRQVGKNWQRGITMTCTGFYAPQCRELRVKSRFKSFLDQVTNFQYQKQRLTNFEMETAGIYGLANALGHSALSCNAILANRQTGKFSERPKEVVERLIKEVLERLV